ncbi:MAG: hypothetical protein HFI92_06540 [Lachnospiraceae bacterium]|nr:hypothetical protein [Lachnospiraceae bacterium]
MVEKLAESATLFGALFLLCGTDSSIWCGVSGLALLLLLCLELHLWEDGGRNSGRFRDIKRGS